MTVPLIYLSGLSDFKPETIDVLTKRSGCTHRCFSFAYSCPGAFYFQPRVEEMLARTLALGVKVMMDSSGFSFHKFVGSVGGQISNSKKNRKFTNVDEYREQTVKLYARYCREQGKDWDFYVNFDPIKDSPAIYQMQKRFEKMGLRPVPIFHGDKGFDWFKRYVDEGYKLITVGATATIKAAGNIYGYLDRVHNLAAKHNVKLHGLAMTAPTIMTRWPWWSVDSSTWLQAAIYGKIYSLDRYRKVCTLIHVSKRSGVSRTVQRFDTFPKVVQQSVREEVKNNGFDFEKIRTDNLERQIYNAYAFLKIPELIKSDGRSEWQALLA